MGYHSEVVAAINPEYLMAGARYLYVAYFFFDGSVCPSSQPCSFTPACFDLTTVPSAHTFGSRVD